jgi:hypothetical protein
MVAYIAGLVLVTSAIELTLALLLAGRGNVPTPSSDFLLVYLLIDIGLFAGGSTVVVRGLRTIQAGRSETLGTDTSPPRTSE